MTDKTPATDLDDVRLVDVRDGVESLLRKAVEYGYKRGWHDCNYSNYYRPTITAADFVADQIALAAKETP